MTEELVSKYHRKVTRQTSAGAPAVVFVQGAVKGRVEVRRNPVACDNCGCDEDNDHAPRTPTICSCPFVPPSSRKLLCKCQHTLSTSQVRCSNAHASIVWWHFGAQIRILRRFSLASSPHYSVTSPSLHPAPAAAAPNGPHPFLRNSEPLS